MENPISQVIARVDAYLARTGKTATDFGLELANNTALVSRLRAGKATAKTIVEIWEFLERVEAPKGKRKGKSADAH